MHKKVFEMEKGNRKKGCKFRIKKKRRRLDVTQNFFTHRVVVVVALSQAWLFKETSITQEQHH